MNLRFNYARDYLKELELSLNKGWAYSFKQNTNCTLAKMALIHPEHIKALDLPSHTSFEKIQREIQGPRTFSRSRGVEQCNSKLLWGYSCCLDGQIQNDHLFPYSLGGPSINANRISLCKFHNMVKSSDIHTYPWEDVEKITNTWLSSHLDKLYREVFSIYA